MKVTLELDTAARDEIVIEALKFAIENPEFYSKKTVKAYKRVIKYFMTPQEVLEYFGEKEYNKYYVS